MAKTHLSKTSESSAEISGMDLTEDDVEDFVLSIDIGLVNMGLCWYKATTRVISKLELI